MCCNIVCARRLGENRTGACCVSAYMCVCVLCMYIHVCVRVVYVHTCVYACCGCVEWCSVFCVVSRDVANECEEPMNQGAKCRQSGKQVFCVCAVLCCVWCVMCVVRCIMCCVLRDVILQTIES